MRVRINLLGRFEVLSGGAPINISSRKGEALLAALALAPGLSCTREELAALLWSDRNEAQARGSLRQELAALRKALGGAAHDVLVADAGRIGLSSQAVEIDALLFQNRLDADPEAAIGLYRGEFLEGTPVRDAAFEEWLGDWRQSFRHQAVAAAAATAQKAIDAHDWLGAIAKAEGLLKLDPLDESGHRALMRAWAATGNRVRALQQFDICRERLLQELSVEPEAGTMRLADDIRAGSGGAVGGDPEGQSGSPDASSTSDLLARPAVLVLPFENLSDDSEQAYFARGITDDIVTALAYWRWFPVIGPNAVAGFDAAALDARGAASSVKARYVLSGSVRRGGDRVRIGAQLIDADSARTLWADRFERALTDVFALQDEISERVVAQVEPQIQKAEQRRSLVKRAADLTAWDYVLRALQAEVDGGPGYGTRDSNERVRSLLLSALEYEPPTPMALALLGRCHWKDVIMGWSGDREGSIAKALDVSRQSIELDPENWLARGIHAVALLFGLGDARMALEHASEAVRLNPSAPAARHGYGCALEFSGRPEEALVQLNLVFRLDPNHPNSAPVLGDITLCNLLLGRYAQAEEAAVRCKSLAPQFVRGQQRYVAALAYAGKVEKAEEALKELLAMQPDLSLAYFEDTYPFVDPEDRRILVEGLRRAGWIH